MHSFMRAVLRPIGRGEQRVGGRGVWVSAPRGRAQPSPFGPCQGGQFLTRVEMGLAWIRKADGIDFSAPKGRDWSEAGVGAWERPACGAWLKLGPHPAPDPMDRSTVLSYVPSPLAHQAPGWRSSSAG